MSLSEVYYTVMNSFIRMTPAMQIRIIQLLMRTMPALRGQILTSSLEKSVDNVVRILRQTNYTDAANTIEQVRDHLAQKIGQAN